MIQIIKKVCIAILILLCSCKENKTEEKETSQKSYTPKIDTLKFNDPSNYKFYPKINWLKNIPKDSITEHWKEIFKKDSLNREFKNALINPVPLKDKTIRFLWHINDPKYLINEDYSKTISEPERAALGFIAMSHLTLNTYSYKNQNKECFIESALDLDYGCSFKQKCFLELWFRNDISSLNEIENCYKQSDMSSSFTYFDKINLTVKGNKIYINCKISGFSRDIWDASNNENFIFLVNDNNIKLIKHITSETEYVYYFPNGSGELPPKGYINNGKGEYRLPKKSKKK